MTDLELKKLLTETKTIASVGLSSNPARASLRVCAYLQKQGYRIIPVNPNETEVLGEQAYPDLKSVPVKVDLVQIFRRPDAVPPIVEDAIAIGAKAVWMQDGAGNPEAAKRAEEAGLIAVTDDCMMRVHARVS
ncbi:MAG TPA: CoA-binding protein [Candidatus Baltobacteraceae bacterium]|nr:CoA-binding protein [Candidatus Baltobacteraceae bacterium]